MSFPEEELWDQINQAWTRMSRAQRYLWDVIKVLPQEWDLPGYGRCWVVALAGPTVLYYNHHEHGFNRSTWTAHGTIDHYLSMQNDLEEAVQEILDVIATGYDAGPHSGPPLAGEYPG